MRKKQKFVCLAAWLTSSETVFYGKENHAMYAYRSRNGEFIIVIICILVPIAFNVIKKIWFYVVEILSVISFKSTWLNVKIFVTLNNV